MKLDPTFTERVELLRTVSVFEDCPDEVFRELATITTLSTADPNDQLVGDGDLGREYFVILEGHATVTVAGETVAELGPGDFFGEMAFLGLRVAEVVAETPMTSVGLHRAEFETLVGTTVPSVARRMLARLTHRLQSSRHRDRTSDRDPPPAEAAEVP